jgi:Stigma-specific protein, Stig1
MKSLPSSRNWLLIGILVVGVVLCAGCILPQNTKTSSQPVFDTSATTAPITQPPGSQQAPSSPNSGSANCRSGLTDCNGFCRDISVDVGNCGACGATCPANSACKDGRCSCKEGLSDCNGLCMDLNSNAKNCGVCGSACPTGQVCTKGQCGVTCTEGKTGCGAVCADLTSDPKNCGACGIACPVGQVCNGGQCSVSCINNLKYCNGQCRDLSADMSNCGSCGIVCPSGTTCQNGVCTLIPTAAPVPTWSGHWITQTSGPSEMDLYQTGDSVTGSYSGGRGRIISGVTSGNPPVLRASWSWDNGAPGQLVFSMSADGQSFSGTYTYPGQTTPNPWTGHR